MLTSVAFVVVHVSLTGEPSQLVMKLGSAVNVSTFGLIAGVGDGVTVGRGVAVGEGVLAGARVAVGGDVGARDAAADGSALATALLSPGVAPGTASDAKAMPVDAAVGEEV